MFFSHLFLYSSSYLFRSLLLVIWSFPQFCVYFVVSDSVSNCSYCLKCVIKWGQIALVAKRYTHNQNPEGCGIWIKNNIWFYRPACLCAMKQHNRKRKKSVIPSSFPYFHIRYELCLFRFRMCTSYFDIVFLKKKILFFYVYYALHSMFTLSLMRLLARKTQHTFKIVRIVFAV